MHSIIYTYIQHIIMQLYSVENVVRRGNIMNINRNHLNSLEGVYVGCTQIIVCMWRCGCVAEIHLKLA